MERVEDLFREIGTLLLAFTPLDAVLWSDRPEQWQLVLTFVVVGVCFVVGPLVTEQRRMRG